MKGMGWTGDGLGANGIVEPVVIPGHTSRAGLGTGTSRPHRKPTGIMVLGEDGPKSLNGGEIFVDHMFHLVTLSPRGRPART